MGSEGGVVGEPLLEMVGGEVFGRQAQFVVEDVGSGDLIMVEGALEAMGDAGEDIQLEAIAQAPGLEAEVDILDSPDLHPGIEATQCEVGFLRDGQDTANESRLMVEMSFYAPCDSRNGVAQ